MSWLWSSKSHEEDDLVRDLETQLASQNETIVTLKNLVARTSAKLFESATQIEDLTNVLSEEVDRREELLDDRLSPLVERSMQLLSEIYDTSSATVST